MSATAHMPDDTTAATTMSLHAALDEVAQTVHGNADSLSLSLDLLKRIIELLLPKATGEGLTLAELLGAVLASMRELLVVEKANAVGIDEILGRLDAAGFGQPPTQPRQNGGLRG
jgi:hypothetical protein